MESKLNYYVHRDSFGRIFFDRCKTNEEHLTLAYVEGQDRPRCRVYLEDMIKDDLIGKVVSISLVDMSEFVKISPGRTCFTFALAEIRDEDSI